MRGKHIKTRQSVKDIKTLDKAATLGVHMKNAIVRSKQSAEETQDTGYSSPSEYAADNLSDRASGAVQEVGYRVKGKLSHPLQNARRSFDRATGHFQDVKRQTPKERQKAAEQATQTAKDAKKTADTLSGRAKDAQKKAQEAKKAVTDAKRTLQQTRQSGRQTVQTAKQTAKAGQQAQTGMKAHVKAIKVTGKFPGRTTGKGTVKTVKKSVKTAERTAKTAVKTAKRTAKTAQHSAKAAAKSAKLAAKASQAATKTAIVATKAAVRGTIALIKATIAALKGLVAIIAAGGWVAVMMILVICLIGLLVGSVFGIFFSGENGGTGRSMPTVVAELTAELQGKIENIKSNNAHDVFVLGDMSVNWPDVLAVYTVKVNTSTNNPAEVATLDDEKVQKLREIFNDMVSLSHSLKTTTQGDTTTVTLTVTLVQKNADDMATQYKFNKKQKEQLNELLDPQYDELWAALIGDVPDVSNGQPGEILPGDETHTPKGIFSWPFNQNYPITSPFGYRKDPFTGATKYHGGVDFGAPGGTPILAAADGKVTVAQAVDNGGWGLYVKIQHDSTYATLYAHCSGLAVSNGQEVKKGQVIAYVGTTGRSTGNHLHWEVYQNGTRVNPMGFFG